MDGITRHLFDNETLEPTLSFRNVWISGVQSHYISISAHDDSEMFVAKFGTGRARPFLGKDVSHWTDKVVPADDVLGPGVFSMRDALLSCETPSEKFNVATEFLNAFLVSDSDPDTIVIEMVGAIRSNSTSRLKDLIDQSGLSQKQLIHRFRRSVGLNPKTFQRITRFNEILPRVMEKKTVSWPRICVEWDYYDQSHFIKEFRQFCGYSPRDFLAEQGDHDAPNFFPLN